MKKLISAAAAAAMLIASVGIVSAHDWWNMNTNSVTQNSTTSSFTGAGSTSGENGQIGSGTQIMYTGTANSIAKSLTLGNINVSSTGSTTDSWYSINQGDKVTQNAVTSSDTQALSVSGSNGQTSTTINRCYWWRCGEGTTNTSYQFMGTGEANSSAGSITVSNVNFSH